MASQIATKRAAGAAGATAKQPRRSFGGEAVLSKQSPPEAIAAVLGSAREEVLTAEVKELLLATLPGALAEQPRHEFQDRMLKHVAAAFGSLDAQLEGVADAAVAQADEVLDQQKVLSEQRPKLEAAAAAAAVAAAENIAQGEAATAEAAAARPRLTAAEASLRSLDAALGALAMDAVVARDARRGDSPALATALEAKARERIDVVRSLQEAQTSLETATTQSKELAEMLLDVRVNQENKEEAVRAAIMAQQRCDASRTGIFEAVYKVQSELLEFRAGPQRVLEHVASKAQGEPPHEATAGVERLCERSTVHEPSIAPVKIHANQAAGLKAFANMVGA